MGLLLLDLDGTLVADALFRGTEERLQRRQEERYGEPLLLEGRREKLRGFAGEGDRFAIITNQGGVAWGYHTEAEVYERIGSTLRQLDYFWERPFSVHVAFEYPGNRALPQYRGESRRKPAPTMIEEALEAHGFDGVNEECLMVGNGTDDELAAHAADVEYVEADDFFS